MTRTPSLVARRVRQTVTGFDNGLSVLAAMATHRVAGRPRDLQYRFGGDGSITVPNVPGARVPVYELFVEDDYKLEWFTRDLGEAPVALDVGAHVGCFSVAFARMHPGARVDAYEASPSTAEYLLRNLADNGLGDRVFGKNLAVQGVAGTLELADNGAASGHNGVLHLAEGGPRVTVRSVSMAEALTSSGRTADLVKIDTEGGEYDMVLGSSPDDWAGVRRVVLEYHDLPGHSWEELETFFTAAGLNLVEREQFTPRLGMAWLSRDTVGAAPRGTDR